MKKHADIWYAVVNPCAGSGKTLAEWRETETMLFDKGISYKFVTPETTLESNKRIKIACHSGFRKFIAVGGDGTIHQVIKSIVDYACSVRGTVDEVKLEEFKLAVLPIGSGNDWIRSHNVPRDHKEIVDLIAMDSFFPQDIIRADIIDPTDESHIVKTAYMANVGGYNFDANVCDVVNFQKSNGVTGKMIYVKALLTTAIRQKSSWTKIICDGVEVYNSPLYSISIGNGRYSGGGLIQTPKAVMNDGIMDMVVASRLPLLRLPHYIKKLLNGTLEDGDVAHFFRASDIYLIPEGQGQLVEVDGDIIGRAPVHFSVLPEQINVLHVKLDEQDATDPSQS